MSKIEQKAYDVSKVLDALKGYECVEIFIDEDDCGSGWIEIDGATFYFDNDKKITKTDILL